MSLPELIARELLFGNPENVGPQLSPDATMLAYLAPSDGLLAVWVRTVGAQDERVVARDPERPIHRISWRGDSRHVLYLQDHAGDENYHLFQVDVTGGTPQELTPGERVKVEILDIDPRFPSEVLITSNARDERLFDVYRLDLERDTAELAVENPGDVSGWLDDNDFIVRAAIVQNPDGSSLIRVRDDAVSAWRTLDEFTFEEGFSSPVAFSPGGRSLYAITSKDANAARLLEYDLATGTSSTLIADPTYDIANVYVDPATRRLVAAAVARDRTEWTVLDATYAADFAALASLHAGDLGIDGASADGNTLVVHYSNDTGPTPYYVYDRAAKSSTLLFYSRPALLDYALAPMQPIVVSARDGLELHGYLTLPVGIEPRHLPTAMLVHGGPWHRIAGATIRSSSGWPIAATRSCRSISAAQRVTAKPFSTQATENGQAPCAPIYSMRATGPSQKGTPIPSASRSLGAVTVVTRFLRR